MSQPCQSWGRSRRPGVALPWWRDTDGCRAFSTQKQRGRRSEGMSHLGTGDGQQAAGWTIVPGWTWGRAGQLCLVAEFSSWALLAPEMTWTLERGMGKKTGLFPYLNIRVRPGQSRYSGNVSNQVGDTSGLGPRLRVPPLLRMVGRGGPNSRVDTSRTEVVSEYLLGL